MQIFVIRNQSLSLSPDLNAFLPQLNDLINTAFASQDRSSYGEEDPFTKQRIKDKDQLLHELGSAGLLAIAFDTGRGCQESISLSDAMQSGCCSIAVACIKPWKGRAVELWKAQLTATSRQDDEQSKAAEPDQALHEPTLDEHSAELFKPSDWEVCMCASRTDPRYRAQGLVTKCLDALIEHLRVLRRHAAQEGLLCPGKRITLWVSALEGIGIVEYWQRRGFQRQGGPDDAPIGLWTARIPFRIATLKRVVNESVR